MKLEIILRIHDGQNIHGGKPRYIDIPKKDLIHRPPEVVG